MQNLNNSLVSIIMPIYNGEAYIHDAISSVKKQSYDNWELIIIDDHSNDASLQIAQKYAEQDERIKVFQTEMLCSGAAKARNLGVQYCTGRYIAFLDCDDYWSANKIQLQIALMKEHNANFCYGSYAIFSGDVNNLIGEFRPQSLISYSKLLRGCDIGCLTVMYDSYALGKHFFPMVDKEDYALWLKILKSEHARVVLCESIIAFYRVSSESLSSNKWRELVRQYNVYRRVEGIGVLKSLFYLSCYTCYGLKKHYINYRGK
ncbi:glycosyltransferase family 2 protein [Pseudocitrobacter sp. 73]|uniref:glycosyltransferase family 2 protein n=1 Tax=Pseudocitrobacter sp. 73 TaxID=2605731 RepID=UPI00165D836A|nr:glycosyltransferase family 2 protein [Pseudocitrobacter sp. 73]